MHHEFLINIPELNCYVEVFRNAISDDICEKVLAVVEEDCNHRFPNRVWNKTVLQARCNCLYADEDITQMDYSNSAIPAMPWRPEIEELRHLISSDTFHPNSCLCNAYVNVDDVVPLHRDKDLFDGNNFVCTVSLGGTRVFRYERYKGVIPADKKIPDGLVLPDRVDTLLNQGDVVYMHGNANFYFEHEVRKFRKTLDKFPFKPRYSCTFRVIENGTKPIFYTIEEMQEYYEQKRK